MGILNLEEIDPVQAHLKQLQIWRRDAKKFGQKALYDLLSDTNEIIKGFQRQKKNYQEPSFTITKADAAFSRAIKARAGYKCEKCGKQYQEGDNGLHCSHHYSRRHFGIRHHPDNALALCHYCHNAWFQKDVIESAQWLFERLGAEKLARLAELKNSHKAKPSASEEDAIADFFDRQTKAIEAGEQSELFPFKGEANE